MLNENILCAQSQPRASVLVGELDVPRDISELDFLARTVHIRSFRERSIFESSRDFLTSFSDYGSSRQLFSSLKKEDAACCYRPYVFVNDGLPCSHVMSSHKRILCGCVNHTLNMAHKLWLS